MSEEEDTTDPEHAYEIVLPLLDSMSHAHQRDVVFNWVKYVMVRWAEDLTPPELHTALPAFTMLAARFAANIMAMPVAMGDDLDLRPCGGCPRCKEEGKEPPEPVGASKGSSSN